jgi:DNA replication protein DnaC
MLDGAVGEQPAPVVCRCGEEWPWTWFVPVVNGTTYSGRWAAAQHDPCRLCAPADPALQREHDLQGRLERSGFPTRLTTYTLEPKGLVQQRPNEGHDAFRERVKSTPGCVLGVSVSQVQSYRQLIGWRPPTGLVLHGPPGTGKTTVMAALARKLASVGEDEWVKGPTGRRTLRRAPSWAVEYHRLDDVVDRERVKMRGLDESPLKDVARTSAVLFLDELGLKPKPTEFEATLVERIVGYRSEHGLCTVVATNRDYWEVAGDDSIYGRRTGDRLRQYTDVPMTGESWR